MAKPLLSRGLNSTDAAISWFRQRVPMTDKQVHRLEQRLRDRAFYVSGVSQLRMVSDIFDSMRAALENGTTFEDFKSSVQDRIGEHWIGQSPYRLENIFRTNIQRSYMAGRMAEIRDPAVARLRPFLRYDGILDDATCPICSAWDGTTLEADDPAWGSHTPPMHFQCRCTLVSLAEDDVDEDEIDDAGDLPAALDGFGDEPNTEDVEVEDLTGVDPELLAEFNAKSAQG